MSGCANKIGFLVLDTLIPDVIILNIFCYIYISFYPTINFKVVEWLLDTLLYVLEIHQREKNRLFIGTPLLSNMCI